MRSNGWIFLVVVLFAGCIRIPASLAPSNIPVDATRPYEKLPRITASDTGVWLFGFIPLSGVNEIEEAYRSALKQSTGSDALIEVAVEYKKAWYVLLTQETTFIYATPIRYKKTPEAAAPRAPALPSTSVLSPSAPSNPTEKASPSASPSEK